MNRLAPILLSLLAACGTPQEQCITRSTRDLRTVDRLIAETQANLDRGYALETMTIPRDRWGFCDHPVLGQPSIPCLIEDDIRVERPIAIDLAAEAEKLKGLQAKRAELARAAQPVIAQCRAEYPE